jgi:hypothetical protein
MRCYEVFHVRADHTWPLLGLAWGSVPDLGSSSDWFAKRLKRRIEVGR